MRQTEWVRLDASHNDDDDDDGAGGRANECSKMRMRLPLKFA